jgi:hypothetical protein
MACRTASSLARACALAFATLLAWPGTARAAEPSPADKSLAQSLFDEGRHLMDQGRYADACPRLADSERLDPGGGTVLNLALCYDKLGKLALAYSTYEDAISLAITEQRHERETFARERVAALAPRLPHLTLVVTGSDAASVTLDGSSVPRSAWGLSTAVDPGEHTVAATAPGFAPSKTTLTLAEGEARDVSVALAPLAPLAPPPAAPAYSPAVYVPLPPPEPATRRSTAFYVLGGLAGASLVASAVTGGIAWAAHESVASKCSTATDFCSDPSGISDASRARTFAWISTGTLVAGGVLGILTFALPLREPVTPVTLGVAPVPVPGGAVATVTIRAASF